jgi:hypothetical protein
MDETPCGFPRLSLLEANVKQSHWTHTPVRLPPAGLTGGLRHTGNRDAAIQQGQQKG